MKSIMEESKIVENFTLLLYSRTYETLYLEIFHSQNKNLLSKHVIKTSDHVTIELGMPLNKVQMMVKKSEQSLQILNEFKFRFEDFNTNSTVQQMDHYVKLKKKFPQYSLLFQIFYQLRSSINSSKDLGKQEERQAVRVSELEKKKQHQNELKDITKSNLILLGFKVVNSLFRKQTRNKTALPSDDSLSKKSVRRNKKFKTTFFVGNNYRVKKPSDSPSNIGKYTDMNSSINYSKQKSVQGQFVKFKDFKDHIEDINIQEKQFQMRKPKKNLTINAQQSGFFKKRSSQKKITFDQHTFSIQNQFQENVENFSMIKFNKNINSKQKPIRQINDCQKNFISNPQNFDSTLENSGIKDKKLDYQDQIRQNQIFSSQIQKNDKLVIRKLKKLCQQKSDQMIIKKKAPLSKLKHHMTEPSFTKSFQSRDSNTFDSISFMQNNLENINKKLFGQNKIYRPNQCFYKNLYESTKQQINRQSQIIEFVKKQCINFKLQPSNNQQLYLRKSKQTFQDLKVTNTSTETNETVTKLKDNKLKKVKAQDQFLKKFKIYLNGDKKLRS